MLRAKGEKEKQRWQNFKSLHGFSLFLLLLYFLFFFFWFSQINSMPGCLGADSQACKMIAAGRGRSEMQGEAFINIACWGVAAAAKRC